MTARSRSRGASTSSSRSPAAAATSTRSTTTTTGCTSTAGCSRRRRTPPTTGSCRHARRRRRPARRPVLLDDPVYPGVWVEARPVGVLYMQDEAGEDAKLICVPPGEPRWAGVEDVSRPHAAADGRDPALLRGLQGARAGQVLLDRRHRRPRRRLAGDRGSPRQLRPRADRLDRRPQLRRSVARERGRQPRPERFSRRGWRRAARRRWRRRARRARRTRAPGCGRSSGA